jgi:carbamoyltransferase
VDRDGEFDLSKPALLGISGAKRNACAAICVDGQISAACEQERLTRARGVGLPAGAVPVEAVDHVIALSHSRHDDVESYVVAEPQVRLPKSLHTVTVDHHRAHAAAAFLTSPFDRAVVLVCDSQEDRELSVWIGNGARLEDQNWPWRGRAFATLYSECAELFEFAGPAAGQAYGLEVLAHLGRGDATDPLRDMFRYVDGTLEVEKNWRARLHGMIQAERQRRDGAAETAAAIQARIGELLLELLADIRKSVETDSICLGGGLFYNTYFNSLVSISGIFKQVFVPINPGNAGLAVGGALMVGRKATGGQVRRKVSPFLGPEYDSEAIKTTLDGCKLSYEYVTETEALDSAVAALSKGQLVAWFQGRMEWGHRALGHRSILADPRSPYVLDNLNFFLRKRERSRPFGVSVCEEAVPSLFCGPAASPFMEFQYRVRDDQFRHVMPAGATAIRVQTVAPEMGLFWSLLKRMEQATGSSALVNTSFNAFHEPIVCNPRDAVRVFFGTGLDMLVIGRFIVRK